MLNRPEQKKSKRRILGLVAVVAGIILLPMGSNFITGAGNTHEDSRVHSETNIIIPGVRVGDYKLGMSKDDVLKSLGKPKVIFHGGEKYTLNNLPKTYFMRFDDISFEIVDDSVQAIVVHSPLYKFTNGLGVGDSKQEFIEAFGLQFQFTEDQGKLYLTYKRKGLQCVIHSKNRTVMEINVSQKAVGKPRQMESIPKYDPNSSSPWKVDLRSRDLSKLNLRGSIKDLLYASFDDRTIWPAPNQMPPNFDWQRIMELGKNPGLGVRSLHKKGITGRGVAVAIIDQPLLVDHQEYAKRLRLYEEIHIRSGTDPQMHGAAVASIALGKTVGVAPEADLYYIAQFNWDREGRPSLKNLAQAIHRIVEINEQLPKDKKIRVISISKGWGQSHKDYREITKAVRKAKAKGILVLCTSVENIYEGFDFGGLGRSPLANPDIFGVYEPGLFLAGAFKQGRLSPNESCFWVPMDSRTTASPGGSDEYVFYREGGFSWAVPYIAGVYALAVQVDPNITPKRFWALAIKTGRIIKLNRKGKKYRFGPILDPVKLITVLKMTGK